MAAALTTMGKGLKVRYPHAVRNAFAGAIVFHLLLFVFSPPFDFKPYEPPPEPPILIVAPVDEIEIPDPPLEVPRPDDIVPEPFDGDVPDVDMPFTTVDDLTLVAISPRSNGLVRDYYVAFDKAPDPIRTETPVYPNLAREAGIEGDVLIGVLVGVDGKVLEATVLSSDVTSAMERAAVRAAMKWRFRPAKQGSNPVKARVAIPFSFRLR